MPDFIVRPGVPVPQTSTTSPVERRLLTENNHPLMVARTIELDERQVQSFTWALNTEQAAAFRDWWRVDLVFGGAWFAAPTSWPTPEGLVVKVRRFLTAPAWQYLGNGNWTVSAAFEVRGRTLLPLDAVEPPDGPYFLDNFEGSEMSLFEHTPDIAPEGFAWVKPGFGDGLRLEGGRALMGFGVGATNYNNGNQAPSAWEVMDFDEGLRIEFDGFVSNGFGEYVPLAQVYLTTEDLWQIELTVRGDNGQMNASVSISGDGFSAYGFSEPIAEGDFEAVLTIYPNGIVTIEWGGVTQFLSTDGNATSVLRIAGLRVELSNIDEAHSNADRLELSMAGAPPDLPPTGVLFSDEFTGSGTVADHTPDVAPDGFAWTLPDGNPSLSLGGGYAYNPDGVGTYALNSSNVEAWSIEPSNDWRMEITANTGSAAFALSSWYLAAGDDISAISIQIETIEGSDPVQSIVRVNVAGGEIASPAIPGTTLAVRVEVHGSDLTLYVDDVETGTLVADMSGFATITYTEVVAYGAETDASIEFVRLSMTEAA